jgi:InsA N-terminal domain
MTFIAVRCPHCQSDQIVKRGKTARGTQRYLCQNTLCAKGSFLLDYCNRGCLPEVKHMIIDMSLHASGVREQPPQSTRRNALPVKRIDGALLMGHKYLACALV